MVSARNAIIWSDGERATLDALRDARESSSQVSQGVRLRLERLGVVVEHMNSGLAKCV